MRTCRAATVEWRVPSAVRGNLDHTPGHHAGPVDGRWQTVRKQPGHTEVAGVSTRSGKLTRYTLWVAVPLFALVAGCSGPATVDTGAAPSGVPPLSGTPSPAPSTSTSSPSPTPSTADPGLLPQTHALPSPDDPLFQAGVQDLWQAIVTDNPTTALPFFFPETAYLQVKAISNPSADYQNRLVDWYRLDIGAAHTLLGSDASSAKFVRVTVPTAQAVWIVPGVEYNKGSYYRVYGTRLYYQVGGRTKSIGIYSLISWRGEWYVVHLGPSTRSANRGIVYNAMG